MRVFIVLNPVAGRSHAADVRQCLARHFPAPGYRLEIYETTGREDIGELVASQVAAGVERVFAAGGDGTVSAVVDGLARTEVPLGIIPAGTSNVIAQDLNLPLKIDKACQMLAGDTTIRDVDALLVDGRYYVLAVGTGADALTMKETGQQGKRRFGALAYIWTALKVMIGMQPRRFTIIADGKSMQINASVVLLSNVGTLTRPLRWGAYIYPDDGQIDINIVRGKNLLDYLLTIWEVRPYGPARPRRIRHLTARESITVMVDEPLPVQGDGDLIGETPIHARVIPKAVRILVPWGDPPA